jgi:ribosomal protein L11 methyltransferase
MSWNQLTVDVPEDLVDSVVGEVSGNGIAGVWESLSPAPGSTRLVFYFPPRLNLEQPEAAIRSIFKRSAMPEPVFSRAVVEDHDWTEEWKKSYSSFEIGDDFFIIPSWERTPCPEERLPIRIDPGQAFGTGTHETTQMTMESLARWVEPEQEILDVGTGSGILAIASRLLGATQVFACDHDPVATEIAQANIERNRAENIFTFCGSLDSVKGESMRLVLGNLTAEVIIALLPEFSRVLKPNGLVILSGILTDQREEVRAVIAAAGFVVHEETTRGEWLALVVEKTTRKIEKHVG